MKTKQEIAQSFVNTLNRAFKADPRAISNIVFEHTHTCNRDLADDATVAVRVIEERTNKFSVSVLGLLNGILQDLIEDTTIAVAVCICLYCPGCGTKGKTLDGYCSGDACPSCEKETIVCGDIEKFSIVHQRKT